MGSRFMPLDTLEPRHMMAGHAPSVVGPVSAAEAPEPTNTISMGYSTVADMTQSANAIPGEWILTLKGRDPVFGPDGEVVDLGVDFVGPASPQPEVPELQARFDALNLGIRFDHYLGTRQMMLIEVPLDVTVEQLQAELSVLEGFQHVRPNSFVSPATDIPTPPALDQEPAAQTGGSGNVKVFVRRGLLVIQGDRAANDFRMEADGAGLRVIGNGETLINGKNEEMVFNGIDAGLRIRLGGGDDVLTLGSDTVTQFAIAGSLSVDAGRGEDVITLRGVQISASLELIDLSGRAAIGLHTCQSIGKTRIATGSAADALSIGFSTFGGPVRIETGRDDDVIVTGSTNGSTFAGGLDIKDGPGGDVVDDLFELSSNI